MGKMCVRVLLISLFVILSVHLMPSDDIRAEGGLSVIAGRSGEAAAPPGAWTAGLEDKP